MVTVGPSQDSVQCRPDQVPLRQTEVFPELRQLDVRGRQGEHHLCGRVRQDRHRGGQRDAREPLEGAGRARDHHKERLHVLQGDLPGSHHQSDAQEKPSVLRPHVHHPRSASRNTGALPVLVISSF